jgi:hypothetical protein
LAYTVPHDVQHAFPRAGDKITTRAPRDEDHLHTYRMFVRLVILFAVHVFAMLLLLYWFRG